MLQRIEGITAFAPAFAVGNFKTEFFACQASHRQAVLKWRPETLMGRNSRWNKNDAIQPDPVSRLSGDSQVRIVNRIERTTEQTGHLNSWIRMFRNSATIEGPA